MFRNTKNGEYKDSDSKVFYKFPKGACFEINHVSIPLDEMVVE